MKLLLKLKTEYMPKKGRLHSFIYIVAINELSRLCRAKKKKVDLMYVLDGKDLTEVGFYSKKIKQALTEVVGNWSADIDYDRAYDVIISSLNEDDQIFVFDYLNSEKPRSVKDRRRFSRLKNKLKTIAKNN